jgi:hypothetical protein
MLSALSIGLASSSNLVPVLFIFVTPHYLFLSLPIIYFVTPHYLFVTPHYLFFHSPLCIFVTPHQYSHFTSTKNIKIFPPPSQFIKSINLNQWSHFNTDKFSICMTTNIKDVSGVTSNRINYLHITLHHSTHYICVRIKYCFIPSQTSQSII